jgi:ABC-type phosphate transport system substrate-binding protein
MQRISSVAVLLVVLQASGTAWPQSRASTSYVIIVNPNNPENEVDRQFLEGAFLKKITRWPSDEVIRPAELVASSPARRRFSQDVLERSVEAVKGYWQQRIFSGRDVPPPEFGTNQEVIDYVLKYDGAIGCVSADANLDRVKILTIK